MRQERADIGWQRADMCQETGEGLYRLGVGL